ncbi:SH3 domain-containing protein [Pararhizobium sp. PWRC1-1]|uniref:SH3 domain-containing protein n=1 Tax=Pararhizobium sp. PWRC1-1 TaxID=2804566 RepID=UPI003CEC10CE
MFLNVIKTALVVVAVLSGDTAVAVAAGCVVSDPTATPLNVRSGPQGRVLSTLPNGTAVVIVEERSFAGKRWAKVSATDGTLGWVFATYLDCTMADDNTKSAPMKPRTPPQ